MAELRVDDLGELLEQAGARRCGRHRFDCPDCGSKRAVSVDERKNVFCCHHSGCGFHGGVGVLKQRLGILRQWLPHDEYLRRRREQEQAARAALYLHRKVKARRMELLAQLHRLNDLESTAHVLGADFEETWDALEMIDHDRPRLLAELSLLENSGDRRLLDFLSEPKERRWKTCEKVLRSGGLYSPDGKFVEVW